MCNRPPKASGFIGVDLHRPRNLAKFIYIDFYTKATYPNR